MKKKYDVEIVETPTFANAEEAQAALIREEKKIKFNIVATCFALISTIFFFLGQNQSFNFLFTGFLEYITGAIYFTGVIATIILNPLKTIRSVFYVAMFGYNIVPIIFVNWLAFILFLFFGFCGLLITPVAYAGYNLYDSYKTIKEAEMFLETAN